MSDSKYALGSITAEQFLSEYWQKKPLLIKQALPEFINPLSAEEIAGLACEDFVTSRLITESKSTAQSPHSWHLQHGPFSEDDFLALPDAGWTLHAQGIERFFPDVYSLLDHFRFIPNWRIDDVMVSFAPDKGTAGPHFDQYDVFLVQGLGKKHWRVGQRCDAQSPTLPNCDLSILKTFETSDEWIVEPGDVLYVPPGIAHYGIAIDDSITYSIGFRAPSHSDLLGEFSHYLADTLTEDQRYTDPDLPPQNNPGEISAEALTKVHKILSNTLNDPEKLARWFGEYMTESKQQEVAYEFEAIQSPEQLLAELSHANQLCWVEGVRCAWYQQPTGLDLFVNGQRYECHACLKTLLELLSASTRIDIPVLLPELDRSLAQQLLFELFNAGYFYFE
jgi:50S ribosomal protein L16 3-hydroxylase